MKKVLTVLLSCALMITGAVGLTACGGEKNITVVAREQGSGTREAFDKVVTDGNGNFLEMKVDGAYVAIIHPDCAYDLISDPEILKHIIQDPEGASVKIVRDHQLVPGMKK